MVNYDIILNLFSLVLLFIILFIIMFGCKGKQMNYNEYFTNKEKENKEEKEDKPKLTPFENNILTQLSNGELTTEKFADLIKKDKFTQDNLKNVIDYVEHSKGVI